MGDVTFSMVPVNSIRGQIQLSTGDVAQGITVSLLRRIVQDGRAVWQNEANTKTNIEGVYRFGELPDGIYAVHTEPAMDSDAANDLVETGSTKNVAREGYAERLLPRCARPCKCREIPRIPWRAGAGQYFPGARAVQSVTATETMPRSKVRRR